MEASAVIPMAKPRNHTGKYVPRAEPGSESSNEVDLLQKKPQPPLCAGLLAAPGIIQRTGDESTENREFMAPKFLGHKPLFIFRPPGRGDLKKNSFPYRRFRAGKWPFPGRAILLPYFAAPVMVISTSRMESFLPDFGGMNPR
jgi:hypothetical protein